jgi:predicted acyl esterase
MQNTSNLLVISITWLAYILLSGQIAVSENFMPDDSPFEGFTTKIPMRDGKFLAAEVIKPKVQGKYPAILVQTPYDKSRYRRLFQGDSRFGMDCLFTDSRYTFVVSDIRGHYGSKEALGLTGDEHPWIRSEVYPPADFYPLKNDGYDLVEWIAAQDWCNGKVGTWGNSHRAKAQYETARGNPPHLVCCVPIERDVSSVYSDFYPGGALWQVITRALDIMPMFGAHPTYDEFWKRVDEVLLFDCSEFHAPMLFVGGWYDVFTDSQIEAYQRTRDRGSGKASSHSRLIMGPWSHYQDCDSVGVLHFPGSNLYAMKNAMEFFEYWLQGEKSDFYQEQPLVEYYLMGANKWQESDSWPPEGVEEKPFYLSTGNLLAETASDDASSIPSTFQYDPSDPLPTQGGQDWGKG